MDSSRVKQFNLFVLFTCRLYNLSSTWVERASLPTRIIALKLEDDFIQIYIVTLFNKVKSVAETIEYLKKEPR